MSSIDSGNHVSFPSLLSILYCVLQSWIPHILLQHVIPSQFSQWSGVIGAPVQLDLGTQG